MIHTKFFLDSLKGEWKAVLSIRFIFLINCQFNQAAEGFMTGMNRSLYMKKTIRVKKWRFDDEKIFSRENNFNSAR